MALTIYIATSGSHGDVHPFLAIGRRLRERGHSVLVSVHPYFKRDVENAGLAHSPIGEHIDLAAAMRDPLIMHPWRGGQAVMKLIVAAVPRAVQTHRAVLDRLRPDVILAHHICIGIRWVAEERRLPLAMCSLAPMLWLSPHDPVPVLQRGPSRLWELPARALLRPALAVAKVVENWRVNKLRRHCGFPPERDGAIKEFHGGTVNLGLWSPHMRGPTSGDPPNGRIVGFPWYDRSDHTPALTPAVEQFLHASEPPIVFSLGTAAVHVPGDFYHIAAATCRRLGRRGVLLVGPGEHVPRDLPSTIIAVDYVPFSLLLPRGCCTVHHGGIGSTSQALRSGRPAVIVAHSHDQFHNGLHARRLGVGVLLPRTRLTERRLSEAIDGIVNPDANARAATLREKLLGEDGATIAAEEVERIARPFGSVG